MSGLRSQHTPVFVPAQAISYVDFISDHQVVSASTDSTLRMWDLTTNSLVRAEEGLTIAAMTAARECAACGSRLVQLSQADRPPHRHRLPVFRLWGQVRTFTGHKNQRNFVGMSVHDDFVACGSETSEVYVYFKVTGRHPDPTATSPLAPARRPVSPVRQRPRCGA